MTDEQKVELETLRDEYAAAGRNIVVASRNGATFTDMVPMINMRAGIEQEIAMLQREVEQELALEKIAEDLGFISQK